MAVKAKAGNRNEPITFLQTKKMSSFCTRRLNKQKKICSTEKLSEGGIQLFTRI